LNLENKKIIWVKKMDFKILVTGKPGVGKTTLIKKITTTLKDSKINYKGFWTSEIRKNGRRVGFEYVTTTGKRGVLAHVESPSNDRVSKYGVNIEQFETDILPLFEQPDCNCIFVIDEIGKMEMLSKNFSRLINTIFSDPEYAPVIATIGLYYMSKVNKWKTKQSNLRLFRLTRENFSKVRKIITQTATQ